MFFKGRLTVFICFLSPVTNLAFSTYASENVCLSESGVVPVRTQSQVLLLLQDPESSLGCGYLVPFSLLPESGTAPTGTQRQVLLAPQDPESSPCTPTHISHTAPPTRACFKITQDPDTPVPAGMQRQVPGGVKWDSPSPRVPPCDWCCRTPQCTSWSSSCWCLWGQCLKSSPTRVLLAHR